LHAPAISTALPHYLAIHLKWKAMFFNASFRLAPTQFRRRRLRRNERFSIGKPA